MKKIKSFFCVVLLAACMVTNTFAGSFSTNVFFSFFDELVKVALMSISNETGKDCKPRQCTNCRPEYIDEDGNCRPPTN